MGQLAIASSTPYVAAAFGLAGSLIGGLIAGGVSLRVSRQARDAAERAWMRDSRRQIYDRFLTSAQKLLIACEDQRAAAPASAQRADDVEAPHRDMFEVYSVIQTVAGPPLVQASRVYAYRLWELKEELGDKGVMESKNFEGVAELVRDARHKTVDAMRAELGLAASAAPREEKFNPFAGTSLEDAYVSSSRVRPGSEPAHA